MPKPNLSPRWKALPPARKFPHARITPGSKLPNLAELAGIANPTERAAEAHHAARSAREYATKATSIRDKAVQMIHRSPKLARPIVNSEHRQRRVGSIRWLTEQTAIPYEVVRYILKPSDPVKKERHRALERKRWREMQARAKAAAAADGVIHLAPTEGDVPAVTRCCRIAPAVVADIPQDRITTDPYQATCRAIETHSFVSLPPSGRYACSRPGCHVTLAGWSSSPCPNPCPRWASHREADACTSCGWVRAKRHGPRLVVPGTPRPDGDTMRKVIK
jgi:hypothetical protein